MTAVPALAPAVMAYDAEPQQRVLPSNVSPEMGVAALVGIAVLRSAVPRGPESNQ